MSKKIPQAYSVPIDQMTPKQKNDVLVVAKMRRMARHHAKQGKSTKLTLATMLAHQFAADAIEAYAIRLNARLREELGE